MKEDTSGSVSSSPTCRKEESGTGSQGNMSSEEKKKLLEQYDCESDGEDGEDEYPPKGMRMGSLGNRMSLIQPQSKLCGGTQI